MRKTLLASAAVFGLALVLPDLVPTRALAQDNSATPPAATTDTQGTGHMPPPGQTGANEPDATQPITQGEANGNRPSTMAHPARTAAGPSETGGGVARALPAPDLGPNAGAVQYLQAAQQDLQHRRSGAAQEAMERAETRLLDRATAPSAADQPDTAPAVQEITSALDALGRHDWQGANQHLTTALQHAQTAANEPGSGTMRQGGMMPQVRQGGMMPQGQMPPNTAGAPSPAPGMTAGQRPMPMGGVMPPNGGVMPPNGGVMAPNP